MDQQSSRVPPPRDDRPSRFEGRRSVFDERNSHSDRRDRDGSRERRYSRSRSRSPEYDDRRGSGKRRRSISPRRGPSPSNGRRESRDSRDSRDSREWDGPSPAFRGTRGSRSSRNRDLNTKVLADPASLPYAVTFQHFCDWNVGVRSDVADSPDSLRTAFDAYRIDFLRRTHLEFFRAHSRSFWLLETHSLEPEFVDERQDRREHGRMGKVEEFLAEMDAGTEVSFDYDLAVSKSAAIAARTKGAPLVPSVTAEVEETKAAVAQSDGGVPESKEVVVQTTGEAVKDNAAEVATAGDGELAEDAIEVPTAVVTAPEDAEKQVLIYAGIGREEVVFPLDDAVLLIESVAATTSRASLRAFLSKFAGFSYLAMTEPNPGQGFARSAFIRFESIEAASAALPALQEFELDTIKYKAIRKILRIRLPISVAPGLVSHPERIEQDLTLVKRLVSTLEEELADKRGSLRIESLSAGTKTPKEVLDLYIRYLRVVFHTCFYCAFSAEYAEELRTHCCLHLRRSVNAEEKEGENDAEWISKLDGKLALLVSRETVDAKLYGGKSFDDELSRAAFPHIKPDESGSKFKCLECSKQFSDRKFVERHLFTKHLDTLGSALEQTKYFNSYILDPSHLVPPPVIPQSRKRVPLRATSRDRQRRGADRRGGEDDRRERRRDEDEAPRRDGRMRRSPQLLDPRASRMPASYADLDSAPTGDIVLPY